HNAKTGEQMIIDYMASRELQSIDFAGFFEALDLTLLEDVVRPFASSLGVLVRLPEEAFEELHVTEVSSNGKPLIEVSLEDEQSKGTTKKPRKRKPKTQAKSSTESNEAVQIVKNRTMKPLYPPSGHHVCCGESVTKANLSQGVSAVEHVCEVLPKVPSACLELILNNARVVQQLNDTQNLILASDPDREGEAIAWHIIEMWQQQNALPENINVA
ncbi:DNA topoisomerase, type IA, partial [Tanacetum coccineum]